MGLDVVSVHTHYEGGGVTSVWNGNAKAVETVIDVKGGQDVRIKFLHDGRKGGTAGLKLDSFEDFEHVQVDVLDGSECLSYDSKGNITPVDELVAAIEKGLEGSNPAETVIKFDNHTLKLPNMGKAARILGERGWKILFHIHDFPEDNRPGQYALAKEAHGRSEEDIAKALYPQGDQFHYLVINKAAEERLKKAGFRNVHYLQNAIAVEPTDSADRRDAVARQVQEEMGIPADSRKVGIPVAARGRKNLVEALFWAAILKDQEVDFIQTLEPNNKKDRPLFETMKAAAQRLGLRVHFGVGNQVSDFEALYDYFDIALNTSDQEGFGMIFGEAAKMGKQLVGRGIPGIVDDFENNGMEFAHLENRIAIPVELIDIDEFKETWKAKIEKQLRDYDQEAHPAAIQAKVDAKVLDETVDFADLSTKQQVDLVRKVSESADLREQLTERFANITGPILDDEKIDKAGIEKNRQVVTSVYSVLAVGEQLQKLLNQVVSSKVTPAAEISAPTNSGHIIGSFLDEIKMPVSAMNFHETQEVDGEATIQELMGGKLSEHFLPYKEDEGISHFDPRSANPTSPLVSAVYKKGMFKDIELVLFDIYDTLMCSAALEHGIAQASNFTEHLEVALDALDFQTDCDLEDIERHFNAAVEGQTIITPSDLEKYKPEWDAVTCWQIAFEKSGHVIPEPMAAKIALTYELARNKTGLMPGVLGGLEGVQERNPNVQFGIISNSQIYTVSFLKHLLGEQGVEFGEIFNTEAHTFSHRVGYMKPSGHFFGNAKSGADRLGIAHDKVLCVGNCMTNDVIAAQMNGLKSVLCAVDPKKTRVQFNMAEGAARDRAESFLSHEQVFFTKWKQLVDLF